MGKKRDFLRVENIFGGGGGDEPTARYATENRAIRLNIYPTKSILNFEF